ENDGHQIIAKIDTINFSPTNARARFTLGYNMPGEFAGHPVVFSTNVCVGPGGFKDDFEISLDRDLDIGSASDQEYDVVVKGRRSVDGSTTADEDKVTKLSWDCNGFKSLALGMEVKFSREAVVPENEETGEIETAGRVSGFMAIALDRTRRAAGEEWGFIGNISFPKSFQFTGLPGWGFRVVDAIFDFSDGKNDANMHFPSGYDFSLLGSGSDERLRNTWQGFYLKTLRVNIPKALTDGDNTSARRKSFQTTDILVDKTGFTGFIEANNVAEASESGWRISLDTVRLGIMQTRSVSGRLAGSMGAPFFTDSSRLDYSSNLAVGVDGKVEYDFLINVPSDKDLKMKLWQAKMKLDRSSFIRFSISTARSNAARFEGALNGEIGLSDDISEVPGLSMKGIKFENFAFDTEDPRFFKFSRANRTESDGQMVFSFASPQHTAGGFPLNITDISMNMGTGAGGAIQPRLGFTTELTLSDLGFKASFGMDIVGQMSLSPLDFSIVGVDVKEIGIACEFNGFELDGQLQFYKDHPTFGNGTFGKITATLPMGITGKLEARFGNVGSAANPGSYYDYWYVDGLIKINPGITIFSGFAIYGFGGGAYYHMKMNTKPLASQAQTTQSAPSDGGNSTATYVPSETTGLGLMATVLLGTQPNADVFNMDVTLLAQFSTSGGLETIQFAGNGYIMNQLTERADAPPIRANVVFGYYNTPEAEYVQGTFDVFLNIRDVIKGKGENNKLVSSELYAGISGANAGQWWFYMGKDRPLDQRSGLLIDIPGLTLDASSYIMVGHGIPADLPPLPEFISSVLNEPSQLENQLTNINNRVRSNAVMSSGQGFAFGTSFDLSTQFNFLMFYAKLRLVLGFDANISQNDSRVCAETGTAPGINGWYAQGQAFAGIEGDIGIAVDLFFVKGNFSILNARAAIAMTAKLPNPNYFQGRAAFQYSILEGAVTGRCNFNMEFGQKCTVVSNDPLAGLSFINEMKMSDNSDPANVFSDVVTAFNFPVNQVLEIEEESSGEPVIRRFRPYVFDFNLKKGNTSVSGDNWYVTDQNYLAVLSLNEAMDPETNYTATIELRVKEFLPDGRSIDVMKDGKLAKEVRELHFITGERPDHILEGNVVRSYPLIGQAHYLQGELKSGDKAYVKIRRQDYLFNTQTEVQTGSGAQVETIPAYTHRFVARFTPANGGDHIDRDIVYNASTDLISFDVPTLKNQQTYRLQILKITVPNANAIQQALQSGTRIPPY
ncbi:MAG: hypothetical protein H3C48_16725, partial [Chitinophagaceae bacterium]|nr:hypothetical protein [Chitinophagaceae bacterium]